MTCGPGTRGQNLTAAVATCVMAAFLVIAWRVAGNHGFTISWVTHFALMAWAAVVGIPRRGLTASWFVVRDWEPALHRALGVRFFDRILTVIGWNRLIAKEREFCGTRAGLAQLDVDTRRSEGAHLACLGMTLGIAVVALTASFPAGAAWLLVLAVPLHLHPVGLQRLLRSRIRRLTAKL